MELCHDESEYYEDLSRMNECPKLAEGTFGEVVLGIEKRSLCKNYSDYDMNMNKTRQVSTPFRIKNVAIKKIHKSFSMDFSAFMRNSDGNEDETEDLTPKYQILPEVRSEIEALKSLQNHPNIVKLLSVYKTPTDKTSGFSFSGISPPSLSLVFPYCPIDLETILTQQIKEASNCVHQIITKPHSSDIINSLFIIYHDMLSAISHCHLHGIIHRDIKPGNFILSQHGFIQLADFGLATPFHQINYDSIVSGKNIQNNSNDRQQKPHAIGTLHYLPPETLYGSKHHTPSIDIFSAGLVFYDCINSMSGNQAMSKVFKGVNVIDQLSKLFQVLGTPDFEKWPNISELPDFHKIKFQEQIPTPSLIPLLPFLVEFECQLGSEPQFSENEMEKLLRSMLTLNPQKRPSAKQCLENLVNNIWNRKVFNISKNMNSACKVSAIISLEERMLLYESMVPRNWVEPKLLTVGKVSGHKTNKPLNSQNMKCTIIYNDKWKYVKERVVKIAKSRKNTTTRWEGEWGNGNIGKNSFSTKEHAIGKLSTSRYDYYRESKIPFAGLLGF